MRSSNKVEQPAVPDDPYSSVNFALLSQQLPRQTVRWCQLSQSLLSLTIPETLRPMDISSLSQFLEVIYWRAHGKITPEEFSVLYQEWAHLFDKPAEQSNTNTKPSIVNSHGQQSAQAGKKKGVVSIAVFRALLLEKKLLESDLDLFIGILIHENNNKILNQTISFGHKKFSKTVVYSHLEVVTSKWLALSEELFFTLDTPGYGTLRFEESFFFIACLVLARKRWQSEEDLEAELSITHLVALSTQFMRDVSNVGGDKERSGSLLKAPTSRTKSLQATKQEVNLVQFKRYLMKKSLGEGELQLIISHVRQVIDTVIKLAKINQVDELFRTCQSYEQRGNVLGCPRLFQESVLLASGFVPPTHSASPNPTLPPVLLFLLSDSEKLVYNTIRCIEFTCNDEDGFVVDHVSINHENHHLPPPPPLPPHHLYPRPTDTTNPFHSPAAANEELHDNITKIYLAYKKWSQEGGGVKGAGGGGKEVVFPSSLEIHQDPVYRLIHTSLCTYKRLQGLLAAALFDIGINDMGKDDMLAGICGSLLGAPHDVLAEFGLVDYAQMNIQAQSHGIHPSNAVQTVADDIGHQRLNVDDLSSHAGSVSTRNTRSMPSYDDDDQSQVSNRQGQNAEDLTQSTTSKISNLPAAARRRASLHASSASDKAPPNAAPTSTLPNYFKPTTTYLAKTSKLAKQEEEEEDAPPPPPPTAAKPKITKSRSDVIEKEAAKAEWKALLDLRSKSAPRHRSSQQDSSQPSDSLNQSLNSSAEQQINAVIEAELVSRLLSVTDPKEQADIIEQLRHLKLTSNDRNRSNSGNSSKPSADTHPSSQHRFHPTLASHNYPGASPAAPTANSANTTPTKSSGGLPSPPAPPFFNTSHRVVGGNNHAFNEGSYSVGGASRNSDAASVSSMPSSIADLLQQGHSPGKYASMLREILRKMSRDDSHVRIKSLEQVLQLGQEIVKKETNSHVHSPQHIAGHSAPAHGSSPTRQSRLEMLQSAQYADISPKQAANATKVIPRRTSAPGAQPEKSARKPKKAFGHPV